MADETLWRDLALHERELHAASSQAVTLTADVELAGLLRRISQRRRARAAGALRPPQLVLLPGGDRAGAPGSVLDVVQVSGEVSILRVVRPPSFRFQAGQHVKLGLPGGPSHTYSIASAPSDPYLEFCIERVPGGRLSPQLCALRPGATVRLDERARGDFLLERGAALHVMLATVTGIAPFRSMLREAAASGSWSSRFIILHGASFEDELAYRQELQALARAQPAHVRYLPSISRPAEPRNRAFKGLTGRVADLAPTLVQTFLARRAGRIQVYACGNPQMVASVQHSMAAMNLPVRTEIFD